MPVDGSSNSDSERSPVSAPPSCHSDSSDDAFHQLVSEHSSDGFFIWHPDQKRLQYSKSFARLLGFIANEENTSERAIAACIHKDDFASVKQRLEAACATGRPGEIDFRMYTKMGELRWYKARVNMAEWHDDGRVKTAIGSVSDINELRTSLQATKQRVDEEQWLSTAINELLQSEADNAFDHCLTQLCERLNVDHIVLRQVRHEATQFRVIAMGRHPKASELQLTRDRNQQQLPYTFDLLNQGKYQLISDIDNQQISDSLRQRMRDLNIQALATIPIHYRGNFEFYLSLLKSHRVDDWGEYNLQLARIIGDAIALVASRRQISHSLIKSEARSQNVLDATADGLFEWNLEEQSFFVIPAFLYMFGYDEEWLPLDQEKLRSLFVNESDFDAMFIEPKHKPKHLAPSCFEMEIPMHHAKGHTVWVLIRGKHLQWNSRGNATRCVGIATDISRYQAAMNQAPAAVPERAPNKDSALANAHILLVEDNAINQRVAQGILRKKVANVTIANNGKEAVDLLEQGNMFDAILMDMEMPIMDGYQATQVIRKHEKLKNIPIIAVTAHAMTEDRQRCLDYGMNDHVPKPIVPKQLYNALCACLTQTQ